MERKTITIDALAYDCLEKQKTVLRENGWSSPNFSDAVKLACGKIKVVVK